jgi:hypothetical protein
LNNFVKENSKKPKPKVLGKLGQTIGTTGKPLMSGFLGGDFMYFRPKVGEDIEL